MLDLVTGGAGFVGSHLVRALIASGRNVRVLDAAIGTSAAAWLAKLAQEYPGRVDLISGSVGTPVSAGRAVAGVERVFHLAAQTSVARSMEAPLETMRTNATGTAVMAEAARAAGVGRFVFVSTCAVYPGSANPVSERDPVAPTSPYAASKLAAEAWLQAAQASMGLESAILRLFNVIGPGQRADSQYGAVVPRFMAAMRSGKAAQIFGDGKQTRDFVAVSDAVDAILAAGRSQQTHTGPINIANGKPVSVLELFDAVARVASERGVAVQPPVFHPARLGEVRDSVGDTREAKQRLGWSAEEELGVTLRKAWHAMEARSPGS